jgi:serine/threonine protein kinase
MGLDDVLRLGHLCLAIDQTSDRPKSRTTLLDYMAPEMLSIRPHNEHELALLNDDSDDGSSSSSMDDGGAAGLGQQQQQQYWESLQTGEQQQQVPRYHLGLLGHTGPLLPTAAAENQHTEEVLLLDEEDTRALQPQHQQQGHAQHQQHHHHQHEQGSRVQQSAELEPSRQASLDATALEQLDEAAAAQAGVDAGAAGPAAAVDRLMVHSKAGRCGSKAFLGPCRGSGSAEWEYQDHYDEKVDVWQLGCMLHELLCGSMPFEVGSRGRVGLNWGGCTPACVVSRSGLLLHCGKSKHLDMARVW